MKENNVPYIFSVMMLCATIALGGYFVYDYRYPPSTEDLIAKARSEQPAIKAAIKAYDMNPYSVDFVANLQGSLQNETLLFQIPVIDDRGCCYYNTATKEIAKNVPEDFIFPEPPEESW